MPGSLPQPAVRFGSFEVNPLTGELRKQGIRIKLHEKPFQVLLALLEHSGEVVTRKELQERLWPGDTFVEFENGLNTPPARLPLPRRGFAVVADAKSRYFPSVATNLWDRSGCVPGDWRGVSLCCNPQTGNSFSCRAAFPEFGNRDG